MTPHPHAGLGKPGVYAGEGKGWFWCGGSGPPREICADHRATIGLIVKKTHGRVRPTREQMSDCGMQVLGN